MTRWVELAEWPGHWHVYNLIKDKTSRQSFLFSSFILLFISVFLFFRSHLLTKEYIRAGIWIERLGLFKESLAAFYSYVNVQLSLIAVMLSDQNVLFHDVCVENKRKHLLTEARERKENWTSPGSADSLLKCVAHQNIWEHLPSPLLQGPPLW